MKAMNTEEYIITFNENPKNNKKILFFKWIIISNSLYYLEKEDIINLSKCSKSTNRFVENNNLLFLNLLNDNSLQ